MFLLHIALKVKGYHFGIETIVKNSPVKEGEGVEGSAYTSCVS